MKTNIRKIAIIIIIILILILIGIIIKHTLFGTKKENINSKMENISQLAISGASKEELSKYFNIENLDSNSIMTGPDSYMREKPSDEIIKQYKLSDYIKLQDKLAANVEKKIKDNFTLILGEKTTDANGGTVYSGSVKGYYQLEYLLDLKTLQSTLSDEYKEDNDEVTNYKAKVIAMKILDDYLSIYENKKYFGGINLYIYSDDEEKTATSYISFLNALQGVSYNNEEVDKLESTRDTRLKEYLENAKSKKIINGLNI